MKVERSAAPLERFKTIAFKPDIEYSFADHARYLDAFLVAQDWGTALAFDLAARRPDFMRGLAFMAFFRPMPRWTTSTRSRPRASRSASSARRASASS